MAGSGSRTIFIGSDAVDAFESNYTEVPLVDQIQSAFQKRWDAEGIKQQFVLPADYLTLDMRDQMVVLFNLERGAAGLAPLQRSYGPLQASIELPVRSQDFSHGTFRSRMDFNPALKGKDTGEIIAQAFAGGAADAVFAWMYRDGNSAWGHRRNILNPEAAWAGCAVGPYNANPGSTYLATDFARSTYNETEQQGPADTIRQKPPAPVPPVVPPVVVPPGGGGVVTPPLVPLVSPTGDASAPQLNTGNPSIADIEKAFQARWDAEGIKQRFVLPADFLAKTGPEQTVWLINMVRTASGRAPLSISEGTLQKTFVGKFSDYANRYEQSPELRNEKHTFFGTQNATAPGAVFDLLYANAGAGWKNRQLLLDSNFKYIGLDRRKTSTFMALVGGKYSEPTQSFPGAMSTPAAAPIVTPAPAAPAPAPAPATGSNTKAIVIATVAAVAIIAGGVAAAAVVGSSNSTSTTVTTTTPVTSGAVSSTTSSAVARASTTTAANYPLFTPSTASATTVPSAPTTATPTTAAAATTTTATPAADPGFGGGG